LSAVLEGLVERPKAADQGALFGDGRADSGGIAAVAQELAPRGPGRPSGSQNKSTRELREFYLARYADPLAGAIAHALPADLLEMVRRATALAKLLRCKPLEAAEFMRRSGEGAMPYLHAKAVEMKFDGKVAHAHFHLGNPAQPNSAAIATPDRLKALFDQARGGADEVQLVAEAAEDLTETENKGNSDG
jgi:hypothetical protein